MDAIRDKYKGKIEVPNSGQQIEEEKKEEKSTNFWSLSKVIPWGGEGEKEEEKGKSLFQWPSTDHKEQHEQEGAISSLFKWTNKQPAPASPQPNLESQRKSAENVFRTELSLLRKPEWLLSHGKMVLEADGGAGKFIFWLGELQEGKKYQTDMGNILQKADIFEATLENEDLPGIKEFIVIPEKPSELSQKPKDTKNKKDKKKKKPKKKKHKMSDSEDSIEDVKRDKKKGRKDSLSDSEENKEIKDENKKERKSSLDDSEDSNKDTKVKKHKKRKNSLSDSEDSNKDVKTDKKAVDLSDSEASDKEGKKNKKTGDLSDSEASDKEVVTKEKKSQNVRGEDKQRQKSLQQQQPHDPKSAHHKGSQAGDVDVSEKKDKLGASRKHTLKQKLSAVKHSVHLPHRKDSLSDSEDSDREVPVSTDKLQSPRQQGKQQNQQVASNEKFKIPGRDDLSDSEDSEVDVKASKEKPRSPRRRGEKQQQQQQQQQKQKLRSPRKGEQKKQQQSGSEDGGMAKHKGSRRQTLKKKLSAVKNIHMSHKGHESSDSDSDNEKKGEKEKIKSPRRKQNK